MMLTWGTAHSVEVDTLEELGSLLDKLAAQARGHGMIVQAIHKNGCILAIGLGLAESVLTYFDENGRSFTSVGNRDRDDYLAFEFGGDISEVMGAKAVPESTAHSAAREFFDDGKLPKIVEWEREWA